MSSDAVGSLTVAWDVPSPVPVDYRVMWAPQDGEWLSWRDANESERGNLYPGGGESSATITGLTPGGRYKVAMRARYGGGDAGPWSAHSTGTVAVPAAAKDETDAPDAPGDIDGTDAPDEQRRSGRSGLAARQTAATLVSNMGQTATSGGSSANLDHHLPFTTGDNADGYTITQIELEVHSVGLNFARPGLSIYELSGTGLGTKVGDLTAPSYSTIGVKAWTSTGIDLLANTDYTVLIDFPSSGLSRTGNLQNTASDDEDSGAASGWSIGNHGYYRNSALDSNTWTQWANSERIRITGTAKTNTVPGVPTGFTAAATGPGQIDLSWTAPADDGGTSISGYKVEVSTDGGAMFTTLLASHTDTTYAHTGLAVGSTRHYRVSAINSVGTGAVSAVATDVTNVFVRNTGQGDISGEVRTLDRHHAQAFTTGTHSFGYTLTGVGLALDSTFDSSTSITITVHASSSDEPAAASLGTLTKSGSLTDNSVNTWSNAAGIALDPSTTYFLFVNGAGGPSNRHGSFRRTNANGEDAGAASDWSIADTSLTKSRTASSWTSSSQVLRTVLRGTERTTGTTASSDATLSALTVNGTGVAGFSAATTSYQVVVAGSVETATVAAAATQSGASVGITPDDADTTTDGHQVDLSVGRNAVTVTVTAQDGATTEAYTVSVDRGVADEYGWNPYEDLDGLIAADNRDPRGVWSDGTTIWVSDFIDDKMYAYKVSDKTRDSSKDFNLAAANDSPTGVWSDRTTMWVADHGSDRTGDSKLYAYKMSDKTRDSTRDFDLGRSNDSPTGVWSDGTTMWVADNEDEKLYAYKMSNKARDAGRDFDTLDAAGNSAPRGIWSDGTTMWVAEAGLAKVYAYKMSNKARDAGRDFDTLDAAGNDDPYGVWSDGTTMWVADWRDDDKLYAYNLPVYAVSASVSGTTLKIAFSQDLAAAPGLANSAFTVKKTPDGGSEGTVALSGSPVVSGKTVRLTLATAVAATDTDIKVSYTVPATATSRLANLGGTEVTGFTDLAVSIASSDATLSSLSVNGTGVAGFAAATTSYQVVVAGSVETATVAAAANHSGASVGIIPDDADTTTDGHQVDLSVGRNAVTVTVTAQDGATTEAYTVSVDRGVADEYGWNPYEDFDGLIAADNRDPRGVWSDGTTMWVSDQTDDKMYAYKVSDKTRDSSKDFALAADNDRPTGVWSDRTTMWVADNSDDKMYAYKMSDKTRDDTKDFALAAVNNNPTGVWSDGTTMWVADHDDEKLYAYKMSNKARDAGRDFDTLSAAGNRAPRGIWSDGTTMWVAEGGLAKVYAYKMSNKARDAGRDFDTLDAAGNDDPYGVWSDGTTMWVADWRDDKLYAYNLPVYAVSASVSGTTLTIAFSQDLASAPGLANSAFAVKKTPDGGSEGTVALSGSPVVSGKTVRLTLATAVAATDTAIKVSYTVPATATSRLANLGGTEVTGFADLAVSIASSDATLSALTVNGTGVAGFSAARTSYQAGVASTVASPTVTATPTHSGASVDYSGTDADTNADGHQVALSAGRNAVTVTVTAEDGTTTKEYTVSVNRGVATEYGWNAGEDLDGLEAAGNTSSTGIWSDGTTIWVADAGDDKLYAYRASDKTRDDSEDFDLAVDNDDSFDTWSDETTMWVVDWGDDKLYAYKMSDKTRDDTKDFDLADGNTDPRGVWSDGATMWVSDSGDDKLYAYKMSNKARDSSKDFDVAELNGSTAGVWSDGTTMWVASRRGGKIYAYEMAGKAYVSDRDFNTLSGARNTRTAGVWSDGTTMWVTDTTVHSNKVYSYNLPVYPASATVTGTTLTITFSQDLAAAPGLANSAFAVKKTPDGGSEGTVALSGSPVVSGKTVTLTLASAVAATDTDIKVSYTVPSTATSRLANMGGTEVTGFTDLAVSIASSDATLSALTVSPKDINGFLSATTSYEVGVAAAVTRATVTATAADSGASVAYSVIDADSDAAGHQVDLTAGRNAVTVTVTAEDTTTTKQYTVSVNRGVATEYGWNAGEDLDGLIAAGNTGSMGVWSDGATIWVTDRSDDKLYAYKASDKTRDSSKDFGLAADNGDPEGIWSDRTTMWVVDSSDDKLYAYKMSDRTYDSSKDFNLAVGNDRPNGVWSDGATMWVADESDDKLYAYDMDTKAHDSSKDFDTLTGANNTAPRGVWSDGATMWVADWTDGKLYAYDMVTKAYVSGRDFDTLTGTGDTFPDNDGPEGVWSDGTTLWVVDPFFADKVFSYNLPVYPASATVTGTSLTITFSQDLASAPGLANSAFAVKKTPDGGSEGTVALSGSPVVSGKTVTLTLAAAVVATDTDIKVSYTVPSAGRLANLGGTEVTSFADLAVSIASSDATLSALTVNGTGVAGFSAARTSYQAGVASTVASPTVTATPTHSGASVDYSGTDADTNTDGHQVALSAGRNAVTVTVTAEDGTTTKEYTVSVNRGVATEYGWKAGEDFDGLGAAGNESPWGFWSDGATMWVADGTDDKLYAYNVSDKTRDSSKDFDTLSGAGNNDPLAIWSDGTTMWVADGDDDKLYAYKMSDKTYDSSKDFNLAVDNTSPVGIWSDDITMWVSDGDDRKLYAYEMATKVYESSQDFTVAAGRPTGIWSDETTMWVADRSTDVLHAYKMSDKTRDSGRDFGTLFAAGNDGPAGVWSDGTTMWVAEADAFGHKVFSYNLPVYPASATVTGTSLTITFSQDLAAVSGLANSAFTVKKTPQGGAEADVSLTGSPVVSGKTVTLTLSAAVVATDTDIKVSYTVPSTATSRLANLGGNQVTSFTDLAVSLPSSDATLSALSVNGVGVAGFSAATTSYQAGVASTVASPTVAATPTHSGATVSFMPAVDADSNADGHQVALSAGRNAVTVTVTAEDGTTTKEYTVSVNRGVTADYGWKASEDLDGLAAAGNANLHGVWSDGTTLWLSDWEDNKLYAYKVSDKTRDAAKDFDTLVGAGNNTPTGIWSDGTTMWVGDDNDNKLYAYDMATKAHDSSKDFDTLDGAGNGSPSDIWSDGATMWVSDSGDDKLYAYDMATKAHDGSKDFAQSTLRGAGNNNPHGIWSDGTTMWVSQVVFGDGDKLYAYDLATKARVGARDFDTPSGAGNGDPRGLWSDGSTVWVVDHDVAGKVYSYNLPVYVASVSVIGTTLEATFSQDLDAVSGLANSAFAVKKTPDGGAETTVALSGSPVVSGSTVTLTLATAVATGDSGYKLSYTKPAAAASRLANMAGREVTGFADMAFALSGDTSLSALTVNGAGVSGLAADRTSYEFGVAATTASVTVAATATHPEAAAVITPTDADAAVGHQVSLSAGRNAVTVTVTAQDGSTEDHAVSVNRGVTTEYGWKAVEDFDTLIAAEQGEPRGVWSNGTTMWVADKDDEKLYAYNVSDKARDESEDFDTLGAAGNDAVGDIWSDRTTMWVVDEVDSTVYAYKMSDKTRDSSKDLTQSTLRGAGNQWPVGLWSNGTTMWVSDFVRDKIYAYDMATKAHDSSKDFDLAAGNANLQGIWSDGTTMWVVDSTDKKVYAYDMATKAYDSSRDFDTLAGAGNDAPRSIWSDGATVWLSDRDADKVFSYNLPVYAASATVSGTALVVTFSQDLATASPANSAFTVKKTTGSTESAVTLTGTPAISGKTVTLTLATALAATDTDVKVSYTVPSTATSRLANTGGTEVAGFADLAVVNNTTATASSDATLSALTVSPKDIIGFASATTFYEVGVAAAVTRATVIATAADSGATVTYSGTDVDTTTPGHQVDLTAGRNAVTVTVTAQDTTTTKEYTVSVNRGVTTEYGWKASEDLDGLEAAGNHAPNGVWSNGTTIWVADPNDDKLYAYKASDKTRDSSEDFGLTGGNDDPWGIWSDETTMWVVDWEDDKLYAYKMSDKTRDSSKDFDTLSGAANNHPSGIWSDGATMWVADNDDDKLYAYDMSTRTHDSSKDFGLTELNNVPRGIWSDGTTMWVAERSGGKIYAYEMADKAYVSDRDFDTLPTTTRSRPTGVWSDGTTMWVASLGAYEYKVYSYNLPVYPASATVTGTSLTITFSQDLAAAPGLANSAFAVKKTPDGGSEGTVALSGTPVVSGRTVTLALSAAVVTTDTDVKVSYTVPSTATSRLANLGGTEVTGFADLAVLSTDATLSSLSVNGTGVAGFSAATTSGYQVIVASAVETATVAAAATHPGASVVITPDDADTTTDGHQVDLSLGRNAVTVTVTAQDGATAVDYTVSVDRGVADEYGWNPYEDLGIGDSVSRGIWSDGTTMWVAHTSGKSLVAYSVSDGTRDASRDFGLAADNTGAEGIWSDGTTMWVADSSRAKVFAYSMSTRAHDSSRDFGLAPSNGNPWGVWSDGATMWVADDNLNKLFAYDMSTKARDSSKEFNTLSGAGNRVPRGIWSDGATMWVADWIGGKLYAYDMSTKARVGARDFDTLRGAGNANPSGVWSDGTTMRAADWTDAKVYAYNLPVYPASASVSGTTLTITFSQDLAAAPGLANSAFAVKKTPDGGSEGTVALSGTPAVSGRTVTLALSAAVAVGDSGYKVSYTVPAAAASRLANLGGTEVTAFTDLAVPLSGDTSLSALSVSPKDIAGFTAARTSYEVGVASTVATATVAATAAHPDASAVISSPADADSVAVGHQVALTAGRNAVTVTVTAQDGTTGTHTVSVNRGVTTEYGWKASEDLDGLTAAGNTNPRGVWSNGATIWVADTGDDKLYAYRASDKTRDSSEDFALAAGNGDPHGIWSDRTTMWVVDKSDAKLYAYKMSDRTHDSSKDFALAADNTNARGVWSDGATMWVADGSDDKLYAYKMSDRTYDSSKDFASSAFVAAGNSDPRGVWSDGATMWVADWFDGKLYAYDMVTKAYVSGRDFDTLSGTGVDDQGNNDPESVWSDGTTLWVVNSRFINKAFSYNLPVYPVSATVTGASLTITFSQDLAAVTGLANSAFAVKKTPDGGSEGTAALTGSPVVAGRTVTLTLTTAAASSDTDVKVSYTKPASNKLANMGGTEVESFTDLAVTNNTGATTTVPDAPTGLTATASGATQIDLSWSAPASDGGASISGYKIETSGNGTTFRTLIATQTATSYSHTGLTAGSTHHYRVSAINSVGAGAASATASATTASNDATLSALSVSPKGIHGFTATRTSYEVGVASTVTRATVTATAADSDATVGYSGTDADSVAVGHQVDLTAGRNAVTVTVTAEDGTTTEEYTVSVNRGVATEYGWNAGEDLDTLIGSVEPTGVWSDGTTIWVVDTFGDALFAFKASDKTRDSSKGFDLAALNDRPEGVWSDGTTMWVADWFEGKLYAYDMATKAYDSSKDFDLAAANTDPRGVWSDGVTMWVSDLFEGKLYAYDMATKAYDSSKDFGLAAANSHPFGIWSDGTTMWVSDDGDDKIYAYKMSDKTYVSERDFDTLDAAGNGSLVDIWSDGATMWVTDDVDFKVYSYNLPVYPASATVTGTSLTITFSQDLAAAPGLANSAFAVKKTPDGGSEGTVALSGTPVVSGRTVTLALSAAVAVGDSGYKVSYTVPATATSRLANMGGTEVTAFTDLAVPLSGDTSLSALSVSPKDIAGFSAARTSYEVGVASTVATATVTATAAHPDASAVISSPADADSVAVGHQVALTAGRNAVTVTVTAQDGTTGAYTVSVNRGVTTEYGWKASEDLDGLEAAGNTSPRGVWSNGTTIWVSDPTDDKIYAYKASDKTRHASEDFNLAADNSDSYGIWSDETTMWVVDSIDNKLYAYKMSDKTRDDTKEFDLATNNTDARGVWSDGTTMWVADINDTKLYAYKVSTKTYDSSKDFVLTAHTVVTGVWSDGTTMWVADWSGGKIYAYKMADKTYISDRDFDTLTGAGNTRPRGVWSDGTTMWVVESASPAQKVFSYNLPVYPVSAAASGTSLTITFSQDLAVASGLANSAFTVKKTPDGGSEETVALSGSPVVSAKTVTLTLTTAVAAADTDIKVGYTVPSTSRLANMGGTEVSGFTDLAVTNTTTATVPDAPTGLTATASGATQIDLAWTAPASTGGAPISGYKIETSADGGANFTVLVASHPDTSYSHRGLTAASTRHYRISAINSVGTGTASATASATTASNDATLSSLTVSPKDIIGFLSSRGSYEVGVASTVTRATVTATAADSDATVAYSGTDADSVAVGHQVDLTPGRNAVTVTVTAEDGTTTKDYTVSVNRGVTAEYGWKASDDFDGLVAAGNSDPAGVWSDGTTMWVADDDDDKLYAYNKTTKAYDSAKDIDLDSANSDPYGIWSDGTTMWVADTDDDKLYAYNMSTQAYDSAKDFGTFTLNSAGNNDPLGIWSNGATGTMWVVDDSDDKLYAYDMATKAYDSAKDIDLDSDNGHPTAIWSDDETTVWVADLVDNKLYAYDKTTEAYDSDRDFDTLSGTGDAFPGNGSPRGVWSDGTTVWITDRHDHKVYSYNLPTYTAPGAPTDLTATASGATRIDLAWTVPASDGGASISGYKIETSADGGTSYTVLVDSQTGTSYSHTGLTAVSTRHYRVSAINSVGTGAVSAAASATTAATVPGAPTALTAAARGPARIDLAWTAPASTGGASILGYKIETSTDGGGNFTVLAASQTATAYSHTGLITGSTHHYRVSAINSVGAGAVSNTASDVTNVFVRNIAQGNHEEDETVLTLSQRFTTGPSAAGYTLGSVEIVSADTDGHDFTAQIWEVNTTTGHPARRDARLVPPTSFAAGTLTFTAPSSYSLAANTTYALVVKAVGSESVSYARTTSVAQDSGGASGWGIEDTYEWRNSSNVWQDDADARALRIALRGTFKGATVPGAPTGLTATASGTARIDLAWTAPASNGGAPITGYKVEVSANALGPFATLVATQTGTSYSDTGLSPESTRHYRVSAINRLGTGPVSNTASAATASATVPGQPTALTATASGTSRIDLSWTVPASDGGVAISGYKIESSANGSAFTVLVANTGSVATSYAHTGLAAGSTRHYRVSAINSAGAGAASATAVATTAAVPGRPTALTATASGSARIDLSWSAPSSDGGVAISGYKIESSTNGSTFAVLVANTGSVATSYAHTGLAAGSTRHYRVSAINSAGAGAASATAVATTAAVPGRPTALTATASGSARIDLSWSAPSSDGGVAISGYKIESSTNGSTFAVLVANTGSAATSYAHTGLTAGSTRHYRVSAINSVGAGAASATAVATTPTVPGQPTALTATASGTSRIDLSWTVPSSDGGVAISGYKIESSTNGSTFTALVANTGSVATSYAHTGLTANSTRHYRVSAINSVGAGTASATASATTATAATAPGAPTALSATASGTARIDLAWTAPTDDGGAAISGYRIETSANGGSTFTALVANTGSTATAYAHTGLAANSTRHYRVSAINSVGAGTASATASATTATAATVPGAPTALSATATGTARIDLAWTAPASNGGAAISGYRIETSANGTTFTTRVADTGSTATSYSHTGLAANSTRHYRVSAINSVGAGAASAAASDVTNVFVRNTGQGSGTTHSSGSDQSQRFTTGAHPGGYTLTSVEIVSADGEGDDFTAEIWTVDAVTGHPSAEHAALVAPGSFAAGSLTFAAPPGTVLAAGTIYAVVTSPVGGDVTYSGTTSDGEDAGFASGWAIEDDHEYNSGGAWTDNGSNRSLRIVVRGVAKTASAGSGGTPGGGTVGGGGAVGGGGGAVSGAARGGGGGGGDLDVGVATFVVANGWSPPDIGAAAVLAARTADAVVAYTAGGELSQATAELLREAQPANVIIVGGLAAVSSDVRAQIRSASSDSGLERIDGADRAHTAAAVARRVLGSPSDAGRVTVIVVNGWSPPDIGAAAALAARSGRSAVLYTQHGSLPEPSAALLRDYQTFRVILIGGTAAISDETQAAVAAAAGAEASVTRLTGADRVDTAAQAARRVLGNPAAAPRDITLVIANGWSPPDIGVAAALAAATPNAAVAYTEHAALPQATQALIADYKPTTIIIVGGRSAIADDVRQALTDTAPDGAAIRRITGDTRTDTAARAARRILAGP